VLDEAVHEEQPAAAKPEPIEPVRRRALQPRIDELGPHRLGRRVRELLDQPPREPFPKERVRRVGRRHQGFEETIMRLRDIRHGSPSVIHDEGCIRRV
jgi:hypothetical protein